MEKETFVASPSDDLSTGIALTADQSRLLSAPDGLLFKRAIAVVRADGAEAEVSFIDAVERIGAQARTGRLRHDMAAFIERAAHVTGPIGDIFTVINDALERPM